MRHAERWGDTETCAAWVRDDSANVTPCGCRTPDRCTCGHGHVTADIDEAGTVPVVEFTVRGEAVPQGSPRAFIVGKGTDKERAQVVSGAKGKGSHGSPLARWRSSVSKAAADAMGDRPPIVGPVALDLAFTMRRPASHHVANDRSRPLRENAPVWCTTRPDVGKLARAVEDSLSSVVYLDDAQVVDLHPTKPYGDTPGVRVVLRSLA